MERLCIIILLSLLASLGLAQTAIPMPKFECPPLKKDLPKAQHVGELKPSDISVTMALGDSITAGFGLKGLHINPYDEVAEVRGISWSIGGDGDYNTVPNFIKRYNPDVKGFSIGDHLVETWYVCCDLRFVLR
eukprot:Colp12_sorted_trinity150504_noHs@7375